MVIALDAMGCDRGPEASVAGAAQVSLEATGPDILLVGRRAELEAELKQHRHDAQRIRIVDAADCIGPDESPKVALADKPEASVAVAARLVERGEAAAFVSAGNTGAVTLALARQLPRIEGVRRCALGAVYPTERRHGEKADPFSLILDVGLTLDASADDLLGFALMGAAYARCISRNDEPKVALLSNGAEAHKGPAAVVEAHARLLAAQAAGGLPFRFLGNVEGLDLPAGRADVVVTSGFVGNVVLKMLEGVSDTVTRLARYAMEEKLRYRAGAALLAPAVKALRRATDWEQYGGVPILGFQRPCIKAHGRSSPRAFRNALKVAEKAHRSGMVEAIAENLGALGTSKGASEL